MSGGTADAPSGRSLDRTVFRAMLREEWRMHADLFGPRRFAAFPAFVAALTAAGVWFLDYAGVEPAAAVAGVHALVLAFGLQTGTVGFLGRDAMRNLLGDVTLLVFTARTLPLRQGRLLGVFLLKDLVYYAALFLLPLTLAFVPAALSGAFAPAQVALLWLSLTATFALGATLTLLAVAVRTRGRAGKLAVLGGAVALGLGYAAGLPLLSATPYALFADPSPAALATLAPIPVAAWLGARLRDPEYERPARSAREQFGWLHARLGRLDPDGLVARSVLEVHRSSGGLWKVAFSATLLFVVSAFLVELVAPIVGTDPSTGVTFGALLGLTAFTTFNWLTQFDDPAEYLRLPLSLSAVFRAKLVAFLLLAAPTGLAFLAVAAVWLGARPAEVAVGAVLLVGLQAYLFGLTVYLAGFSPNEFLFDTVLFAAFGAAVAVPLVPALVVGLVVTPVPPALLAGLAGGAVLAGLVGVALYRRAVPKWERALRSGRA